MRKLTPLVQFWLTAVALGLLGSLLSLAVFNLIYRDFPIEADAVSFVAAISIAAITLALLNSQQVWLDKRLPWQTGIVRRVASQLGLAGLAMWVPALAIVIIFTIGNLIQESWSFLRFQDLLVVTGVSATLVVFTVLINLGIFLMQRWRESSLEAERYRKENVEFRFEMLRNQVNPHFLFNSLNTLSSLVYDNPATASSFVRELARVYRYVLETTEVELTPLKSELKFLDAYLYLVKIRYAEGLHIELAIADAGATKQLPPLMLQLLVENAIKHNVVSFSKPLHILITATEHTLTVTNNLQLKTIPETGTNTGLSNIRNRYAFLTERPIHIEKTEAAFSVTLPLLTPNAHA